MTINNQPIEWNQEQVKEMQDKLLAWYDQEKDYYRGEKIKIHTVFGYQKLCFNKRKL